MSAAKPLVAPVTYQGGKQRLAKQIVDTINPSPKQAFADLCCGSGAISIELVNRGFSPDQLTMLDAGPWGLFWQQVGAGQFDLLTLATYCERLSDIETIQSQLQEMSRQPASLDTTVVFLCLQAGAFGGKAIWAENDTWQNCSFRNLWKPTATSNRRSVVNPMMPMPNTLLERVEQICERLRGIHGQHANVTDFVKGMETRYIDPPYKGTTGYGPPFNLLPVLRTNNPIWVSEAFPLSNRAWTFGTQEKGGITGTRRQAHQEWLSLYECD